MANSIICVVCEIPLETEDEIELEICNTCAGIPQTLNNNKNKEELEDNNDDVIAVDFAINRTKRMSFGDLSLDIPDEDEEDE